MIEREYGDEHVRYIKNLVFEASKMDPDFKIFGAEKHKYQLNNPASLDRINDFEVKYQIKLPKEYRFFLSQVGDGGAGPYYGIYSLQKMEEHTNCYHSLLHSKQNDVFIDEQLTTEKWDHLIEQMDESETDEEYDQLIEKVASGAIIIGTMGCSYDILLMYKGSEAGNIVYIDWNMMKGGKPHLTKMRFLEWYGTYFKEIRSDHKVDWYGCRKSYGITERQVIEEFLKAEKIEEKEEILKKVYIFNHPNIEMMEWVTHLDETEFLSQKLSLLMNYDWNDKGRKLFEWILDGEEAKVAVGVSRNIPKGEKNPYYKRMVQLLYTDMVEDHEAILSFIRKCSNKKAVDLYRYALDPCNDNRTRASTLDIMANCIDGWKCANVFIQLMKCKMYPIAKNALYAAMVHKVSSQEFNEACAWMAEKYREDDTIQTMLKNRK